MNVDQKLDVDSAAVLNYLNTVQSIINRMAGNSANCKTWCVTIVTAVIALAAQLKAPNHAWISVVPIIIFCFLDSFYLALERHFIDVYSSVAKKVRSGQLVREDLFNIPKPREETVAAQVCSIADAAWSASILPFYGLLIFMLAIVRVAVLTSG